jgi:hypothetical protein
MGHSAGSLHPRRRIGLGIVARTEWGQAAGDPKTTAGKLKEIKACGLWDYLAGYMLI